MPAPKLRAKAIHDAIEKLPEARRKAYLNGSI